MSAALVIAHPGHELRVHAWLERERPTVCILTDGRGRIESSRKILERAGARPGPIFGRWSDREAYDALREGRLELFLDAARELRHLFLEERITVVAGDALEGYNPVHDACRMILDAAAGRIRNLDFTLLGRPDEWFSERGVTLELDDEEFRRKKAAALGYPELSGELVEALRVQGEAAFRMECLRPVRRRTRPPGGKPFYETHGERRVAEGAYAEVIRYRDHLAPLGRALRRSLRWTRSGS